MECSASGILRFLVGEVPKFGKGEEEEISAGAGAALRFFELDVEFVTLVDLGVGATASFLGTAGLQAGAFEALVVTFFGGMVEAQS